MSTLSMQIRNSLPLKIVQPVVISVFTVLVLAASFMVGKHVGFEEGIEHALTQQQSAASLPSADIQ